MVRWIVCGATLLILAQAASAQPPGGTGAAPPAPASDKKICRKFEKTGSRIAKSFCYTSAQWAEVDAANDAAAKKYVAGVTGAAAKANLDSASTSPLFGLGPSQ